MPQTILVVDDDPHSRVLYGSALLERGYGVVIARNGLECIHLARHTRPAAILLDLRMPLLDGFETLRYLKQFKETRSIPVCAITAYPFSDEEKNAVTSVGGVLEKPMSGQKLVAEIEARVGPPLNRSPSPLEPL